MSFFGEIFGKRYSCLDICRAACCQNLEEIELSPKERDNLIKKGATLLGTNKRDVYRMRGVCPNLNSDNSCAVHGTSEQPLVCKTYKTLGGGCLERRMFRKDLVQIITPQDIAAELYISELQRKNEELRKKMGLD